MTGWRGEARRNAVRRAKSQLAVLRFSGELSTKARGTRFRFTRRLLHNLRDALASEGIEPEIEISHDRIFVDLPPDHDGDVLTRVFGVQSLSVAERRPAHDLETIVKQGEELFRERVRGKRFAVRARRVGNRREDDVHSTEVMRALGAALLPAAAGVDLSHPEVTVHLELSPGEVYFFLERVPAQGGLPLGVEGRGVALVSGGFDSVVAAWHMLRRGVSLDYVFCNLGGASHQQGALRVVKVVADRWSYGDRPRFHCVEFGPVVEEIQSCASTRYWQILLKRAMLRSAEAVARERRASAIVTGEAVGQVSSQTLQNLSVISRATERTILRPLVGFNKDEIIAAAKRIGTFDLSKVVGEYCDMVPSRPATAASLSAVVDEEARVDPKLLERCVADRTVMDLREVDLEQQGIPDLEVATIPDGATVIDLRSKAEFESWHYEGALRLDFAQAMKAYPSFDRSKSYVLYCEYGLKSAHLAEFLRKEGFDAFNFRGGTRALRRLVERNGVE